MADDSQAETSERRDLTVISSRYQGPRSRPLARYRHDEGHPYLCFSPARRVRPSCGCWRMYSYPDYVVVPLIEENRRFVRASTDAQMSIHRLRGETRRQALRIRELEAQLRESRSRFTRLVHHVRDGMGQIFREGTQIVERVVGETGEEIPVGPGPVAPAPTESVGDLEEDTTSSVGT